MKKKIVRKLDRIEEDYISELSVQERKEAVIMIDDITNLVGQIINQKDGTTRRKESLSPKQFNKLLEVINNSDSFAKQKNLLRMTSLKKKFTVNQVYRFLHCLDSLDDKFTILELLVPNISNPKEMYRLFEHIKNS
ncbi:MAG: DUF4476 domain-containing protein [Halanaerobacter sp.]